MKVITTVLSLVILLGLSVSANSTLIDRGIGMIYDTESGNYVVGLHKVF